MNSNPHQRRAGLASLIGTTIEWYDFQIYGLSAAVVFNDVFFPEASSVAGTLASFGVFALGFVARPVGGLIFGHFGDRIGRRNVLLTTLLLMGITTFAVGLIPSYASIGVVAPILLIVMRLLGGVGLGGEWGGAVLLSVEHAPDGKRGFYGSLPQVGSPAGLLLATSVFTLTTTLTGDQFGTWGWRIPFLLSAALVVVGLVIRATIPETPVFEEQKKANVTPSMPLATLLRTQPKTVLLSIGSFAVTSGGYYVYATYMVAHGTNDLGVAKTTMTISGMVFASCAIIGTFLASTVSDRLGRRPVFITVAAFTIAYAFPLFALVATREELLIWMALGIGGLANGSLYGLMGSLTAEIFRPEVRYTGASIGQQVSAALVGGTTPLIVTAMVAEVGQSWPAPAWLAGLAAISLVSVVLLPETSRRSLSFTAAEEKTAGKPKANSGDLA
ncbi:MFS transporter [Prauserella muralis]|uniref:Putative proline/betaine transporter n=1 Tax=Prauserella muralis TaxID=588067 RepID=A0A2V4AZH1_9PSEU|nr:MFS transporter [Prauserella muralis]PXY21330.1 MFS transporter [Prauserella muralis]TWE30456.1 putative MFS family arabinose efflux permease [Prauserella muralis]